MRHIYTKRVSACNTLIFSAKRRFALSLFNLIPHFNHSFIA